MQLVHWRSLQWPCLLSVPAKSLATSSALHAVVEVCAPTHAAHRLAEEVQAMAPTAVASSSMAVVLEERHPATLTKAAVRPSEMDYVPRAGTVEAAATAAVTSVWSNLLVMIHRDDRKSLRFR